MQCKSCAVGLYFICYWWEHAMLYFYTTYSDPGGSNLLDDQKPIKKR